MAKKIAVIDDELPFLELMRIVLEDAGYEVTTSDDAEHATGLIREWQPDLVLLDLHMPGRSGWDILESLKVDPTVKSIPIIFTTAADEEIRATARVVDHRRVESLLKPFDIDDLLEKIERVLS